MARTRSDIEPRIVEAARERFLREGVDGASLRAIASDAGTSIGMVYYYFKTKEDLFFAVVEETYGALLEDMTRACDPALPPLERIRALYRRFGAVTDRESEVVRLVIREALVSSERLQRLLARFQRGHFPLVLQAIADGMREGSIRSDVSPLVLLPVVAAVGVVPQFTLRQLAPGAFANLPDVLVDMLATGISPPGRYPTRTRTRATGKGKRGS
jgi:TetR/AcrR family transcriptional regulator